MRGGIWASVFVCAGAALWSACTAEAASKAKPQISVETVKHAIESKTGSVQLITFPDTAWNAVKIVRGGSPTRDKNGQQPATDEDRDSRDRDLCRSAEEPGPGLARRRRTRPGNAAARSARRQ